MDPLTEKSERVCPYCREPVHPEASLCRHCGSQIGSADKPSHGGVCPWCQERIAEEALICKHCRSPLVSLHVLWPPYLNPMYGPMYGWKCGWEPGPFGKPIYTCRWVGEPLTKGA